MTEPAPTLHILRATPETCFWGFFDRSQPPVLTIRSGDIVHIETLTHQAGDAPDLLMDDGVRAVYEGIPPSERGPGVHIMTGPIAVLGARPGQARSSRLDQRSGPPPSPACSFRCVRTSA